MPEINFLCVLSGMCWMSHFAYEPSLCKFLIVQPAQAREWEQEILAEEGKNSGKFIKKHRKWQKCCLISHSFRDATHVWESSWSMLSASTAYRVWHHMSDEPASADEYLGHFSVSRQYKFSSSLAVMLQFVADEDAGVGVDGERVMGKLEIFKRKCFEKEKSGMHVKILEKIHEFDFVCTFLLAKRRLWLSGM